MLLIEQEIDISVYMGNDSLLAYFDEVVGKHVDGKGIPIRFAVTQSDSEKYHCELGLLTGTDYFSVSKSTSIFDLERREVENTDKFNAVMIVPTGIGAEIGGHAGDAGPAARLLAGACDTLITHPNVVNASDINELPENGLYVEGSVITNLLMGTVGLQKVRANRVIVLIDKHKDERISELTINAVSAARAALGLECPLVVEVEPPIRMLARYSTSGSAVGRVEGLEQICAVLRQHRGEYDAVALASVIDVPEEFHTVYYEKHGEMVNPWGGVEAMLTHAITMLFGVPAAHAPMFETMEIANLDLGIVDPRMSAEAISNCFIHSVLKGLHRSPRIITDKMVFTHPGVLTAADISCVVIPDGCVGLPTLAALEQGIPVIAVKENSNRMDNKLEELPFSPGKLFIVENYLEAVGMMTALKSGVAPSSVRRPLEETKVSIKESSQVDTPSVATEESGR
ncbi:MAG: DUF3326 domain-containing protein [Planctomycetes bacterium]|nr:DUF3326 domain-containing protein [Planctomycetota bacterium]